MRLNVTYGKFAIELEASNEEELASLFTFAERAMELCPEAKPVEEKQAKQEKSAKPVKYASADNYNAYFDAYRNANKLKAADAYIAKRLVFLAKHIQEVDNPNVAHELIVLKSDTPKAQVLCLQYICNNYPDVDFSPIKHLFIPAVVAKLGMFTTKIELEDTHAYKLALEKELPEFDMKLVFGKSPKTGLKLYTTLFKRIIAIETNDKFNLTTWNADAEARALVYSDYFKEIETYYATH